MSRKQLWLALVTAAALGLAACGTSPAQSAATPPVVAAPSGVVAQGQVQPQAYVDLSFNLGGQVADVLVAEGDTVRAGQVLARLADSPLAAAEVSRAEQAVLDAQQALDDLASGADLAVAQAQLAQASAAQQLEGAEQALADLKQAQADATDDDTLTAPTELELAQAEAQIVVAQAALALAEQRAAQVAAAQGDPAAQAALAARLAAAQAALVAAQSAQASQILTAPQSGTVVGLALKPGQHIAPGQTALTLADFSGWVIKTDDLTELEVGQVALGQPVQVTLDALPGLSLAGTLTTLDLRYEDKRGDVTYTGTIVLASPDPAVRWGMTAALSFQP
jgi:multidrug efflux pump subunit AcrA (membrane-fusion protein)